MGIYGLETFIETDFPSDCCYGIKIEKLVKDFCQEKRGKRGEKLKPKIVFHFSNLVQTLLLKGTDWMYGGQSKEILDKIGAFISAFRKLGVEPVFFFRGFSDADTEYCNLAEWGTNALAEAEKIHKFFDNLDRGSSDLRCDPMYISASFEDLSYYIGALYGCEVHKATAECNKEIIQYACSVQNCIAICAQDSNFIIYGAGKYYLSAKNFLMEPMTTWVYDREKFAKKMGLDEWQLPLFGALTDYTSSWKSPGFLKKFCDKSTNERFSPTARYIKQLPYDKQLPLEEAIFKILPLVAEEEFKGGDGDVESWNENGFFLCETNKSKISWKSTATAEEFLTTSVRRFLCTDTPVDLQSDDPAWNDILKRAEELHRCNKNPTIIRKILNHQPYQSHLGLEDTRSNDLPTSSEITRPLRQKLYGILLKEKPPSPQPYVVSEWCVEGPDCSFEPFKVEPLLPEGEHPGLLALWSDDRSKRIQKIRWQLFTSAVSHNLNYNVLRNLPVYLILPTATLFYLWEYEVQRESTKQKLLLIREMEALIATIVLLVMPSSDTTGPPRHGIEPRAVHIATIFNRTLTSITDISALCGYPLPYERTFAYPYFNGTIFQKKYHESKSGVSPLQLCENEESLLAQFNRVSKIVFKDI